MRNPFYILCFLSIFLLAAAPWPMSGQDYNPGGPTITPPVLVDNNTRVYEFSIPGPRGQITDREGKPFALNRLGYNLEMRFPLDREFKPQELVDFVARELGTLQSLTGMEVRISRKIVETHYKNRKHLPLMLARDIPEENVKIIQDNDPRYFNIVPVYYRTYPENNVASHVIGYVGLTRSRVQGPPEANEYLWSVPEGREGVEKAYDRHLIGVPGLLKVTTDGEGNIISEIITRKPQPGLNVITTLDMELQKKAEETLEKRAKRGAVVVLDPNNGDILALASWPNYDLNQWIPRITPDDFTALQDDPEIPLIPRAFRSAYPPGSTFKIVTAIAGLESGVISGKTYYPCTPGIQVGGHYFQNWSSSHMGDMEITRAMAQSCNTFFYRVGMKAGYEVINWAEKLGVGELTGLPIEGEEDGVLPTKAYMQRVEKREHKDGDWCNISIGQGNLLMTPLQIAHTVSGVANGGTLFRTRLVKQIQNINDSVEIPVPPRVQSQLDISQETQNLIVEGLKKVVSSGTGRRASVKGHEVAGKTGTAQWGNEDERKRVAWFCGFAPADAPQYAFCAMYEGDKYEKVGGGSKAAPLVQPVLEVALARPPRAIPFEVTAEGRRVQNQRVELASDVEIRKAEPVVDPSNELPAPEYSPETGGERP